MNIRAVRRQRSRFHGISSGRILKTILMLALGMSAAEACAAATDMEKTAASSRAGGNVARQTAEPVSVLAAKPLEEVTLEIADTATGPPSALGTQGRMISQKNGAGPPSRASSPRQALPALSPDPVLSVTATKIAVPTEQVGASLTVITAEQIRQMHPVSLLDVLQGVPGLDVARHGAPGQPTSIFLRGMNAEHTLVLVDGVRLNDPMSPGRSFDWLDQISPDAVARIEILRGPQGPLYGSDGMGGVIHIITRHGDERPRLSGQVVGGSFGTLRQDYGLNGGSERLRGAIHFSRQDMRGFSNAGARYGNTERDGLHDGTLTGRLEVSPLKRWMLDFSGMYSRARFDLDKGGGPRQDDPNYEGRTRLAALGATSRLRFCRDRLESILRMTLTDVNRETRNRPDAEHPFDSERSQYAGRLWTMEAQQNVYLHPASTLTIGAQWRQERGNSENRFAGFFFGPYVFRSEFSERSLSGLGLYAQNHLRFGKNGFATLGVRHDAYDRFGGATTYHAASAYIIRKTSARLKASWGSGFKAPTLYQLYSPYGDSRLRPERGFGWDAGLEQALWDERVQAGVTFFQNPLRNLIQFNPTTSRYENIARARTQGVESFVSIRPFRNVRMQASYTYTDARDLSVGLLDTGRPLLRRPRNKVSLNIQYQPHRRVTLNLDISRIGQRDDQDFSRYPATRVHLEGFTLINLAANLDLPRHVTLFVRLANVLDTPYEWVKGYGAPRFSAYGGLRMAL